MTTRNYYAFEWTNRTLVGKTHLAEVGEYSNGRPRTTWRACGQLYKFESKAARDEFVEMSPETRKVCTGNDFPEGWTNRNMAKLR